MKVTKHPEIEGLLELTPNIYYDERGAFLESYNKKLFASLGIHEEFVQDNQSVSAKGVVRGMHYQKPPFEQVKLVRVVTGRALDTVVDLRQNSPTYGKCATFVLESEKQNMVYVPAGFAHGFMAYEDNTILFYKCTNFYNREMEGGILWNDPELCIDWGIENPIVSEKDQQLPLLKDHVPVFNW